MKLYHGTTEKVGRAALETGLLPRDLSGNAGNWDHTSPARPDLVYLTDTYAPYFALAATPTGKVPNTKWAIIEVDVDLLKTFLFLPDEDFLEQATRGQDHPDDYFWGDLLEAESMAERTEFFRENLESFQHLWRDSVNFLGNCAYQDIIPPTAITRVAIYDPNSNPFITMTALDPSISTINHQICADKYRGLTSWFFGEATVESLFGEIMMQVITPEHAAKVGEVIKNTTGLEIICP